MAGTFRRLWADRRGAIAPMAAVSLIPALIGVGAAMDVSRLISAKTRLQDAVDSANLALGRMPQTSSGLEMQLKAKAWIEANTTDSGIENLVVKTPVRTTGQIQLDVTGRVPTTFSQLLGVTNMDVEGHSTVKYGTSHVELALVLDNTGSMAQSGKLDALKAAANSLVDSLSASASLSNDPLALRIGVVPFSMAVNIGASNQGQPWLVGAMPTAYGATGDALKPPLAALGPDRFTLLKAMNTPWKGCVESRPAPYDIQDTAPSLAKPATLFVPYFAPDEPDAGYYQDGPGKITQFTSNNGGNATVNNYLDDLWPDTLSDNKADSKVGGDWSKHQTNPAKYITAPKTGSGYTSPVWNDAVGPNSGCNVAPLQRLTTDMTTVRTKLGQMIATGDTEIPLGMVWGWHLLSPNAPFADGAAYNTKGTLKIVVLVTDGDNTYSSSNNPNKSYYTAQSYAAARRIASTGVAADTASGMNDRLAALCNNMKNPKNSDGNDHVIIYTVPVMVSNTTTKAMLQTCASKPEYYIDVANAAGLQGAFANIAGSISGLRVAH